MVEHRAGWYAHRGLLGASESALVIPGASRAENASVEAARLMLDPDRRARLERALSAP